MSQSLWPEGKKSAAMFTFDLDGDIIWAEHVFRRAQYRETDSRPFHRTVRSEPLRGHDSGIYWTSIR